MPIQLLDVYTEGPIKIEYFRTDCFAGSICKFYTAEPEQYVRFADPTAKGKGKSKATDITRLFTYTGWVVNEILDTYTQGNPCVAGPDGVISLCDVPLGDYDGNVTTPDDRDYNNDSAEDELDVEVWLTDQSNLLTPTAWWFEEKWILNIADLVVTEQGLVNDGTKLLQIRFYPVDTTEYTPPPTPTPQP